MGSATTIKTTGQASQIRTGTVIAVAVEKGGAGKTATAVNLAAGLARRGADFGWRILLVDMDPQSTAVNAVGNRQAVPPESTLATLLTDDGRQRRPHEFVRPSPWNPRHLHYLPSSQPTLEPMRDALFPRIAREHRLSRALKPLAPDYHFIVIDTGPANDVLTQNALVAASHVLVPINLDFLGLEAIVRTQRMIEEIRVGLDRETPRLLGFLGTFYRKSIAASEDSLHLLREKFGRRVFETKIPLNSAVPDSFSAGVDVYTYLPRSPGARAYDMTVLEVLYRVFKTRTVSG